MTTTNTIEKLILRPGAPADAERLGQICYTAFKAIAEAHNFPPDFPSPDVAIGMMTMLLGRPDVYSVVAELDDRIVGSNFLWESDPVTGVGPITIDPDAQNGSVGRALMADVIRRSEEIGSPSIRLLQAAYHNRSLSLYTKLGFNTIEPLSLIQGEPLRRAIEGYEVSPMAAADLDEVDKLTMGVHGHSRRNEIAASVEQGTATVVRHNGRITGYATLIGFFGHAVGESNRDLQALIGAAESFAGPGFLLPTRNSELLRWCLENGLRVVQPMTLMARGLYQEPRGAFLPSILF